MARARLVGAAQEGADRALDQRLDQLFTQAEHRAEQRHEQLLAHLRGWERRQRRDVFTALDQEATRTSADLVRAEMPGAQLHVHPHDTLRHALAESPRTGMALEFGVASGTTLALIAEHRGGQPVYGFDSFQGLPERWRLGFDEGAFATDALPEVAGAELVVGWFDEVLPGFLAAHPGPIAFLHLDADLYSSTATVLEQVGSRFVEGTVVVFDEYYNYPGWQQHEHRAWLEHVERTGLSWEYLGLTMDDEQVSVRITRVPPAL